MLKIKSCKSVNKQKGKEKRRTEKDEGEKKIKEWQKKKKREYLTENMKDHGVDDLCHSNFEPKFVFVAGSC